MKNGIYQKIVLKEQTNMKYLKLYENFKDFEEVWEEDDPTPRYKFIIIYWSVDNEYWLVCHDNESNKLYTVYSLNDLIDDDFIFKLIQFNGNYIYVNEIGDGVTYYSRKLTNNEIKNISNIIIQNPMFGKNSRKYTYEEIEELLGKENITIDTSILKKQIIKISYD